MVVLFHFQGYSPITTTPFIRNSYLFVDFFFVLSGFVIALNYSSRLGHRHGVKRFLLMRVGRVYPLHLFMLLCFVALEAARFLKGMAQDVPSTAFSGENGVFAIFTHLFLLQSLNLHDSLTWNAPSWSISTEFWTYVVFAMVSASIGIRNGLLWAIAICAPLMLAHLSSTGMDTTYDYGIVRCVFGFALGVACWRIYRQGALQPQAPAPGLARATWAECLMVVVVIGFVSMAGTSAWSLLAPLVFSLAVLVFTDERGLVSRLLRSSFLTWLGKLSYSIYLTHFLLVLILPMAVKRIAGQDLWSAMPLPNGQYMMAFGRNDLEGTLLHGVLLALTLAFSAFTYRWVETPGREWSRRWSARGAGAARAERHPAQSA